MYLMMKCVMSYKLNTYSYIYPVLLLNKLIKVTPFLLTE